MPQKIRQIGTNQLMISEGGGCLSMFGIPFFAADIFMLLASLKVIPFQNAKEVPSWSYLILFFMAVAFLIVGGALIFGRTWRRVDLVSARVSKVTGTIIPGFPLKYEEHSISDYKSVLIRHNSGDSDTAETFPVFLSPLLDAGEFLLYTASTYQDAIVQAQHFAEFLGFNIEDFTSDHAAVIAPEKAGLSLKDRLEKPAEKSPYASPIEQHSQIIQHFDSTEFYIPGPGFKIAMTFPVIFIVIFLLTVGPASLNFFEKTHTPKFVQSVFIGFVLLFFLTPSCISLLYKIVGAIRNGTFVRIDSTGITIEERTGWRTKRTIISAADILGFDFSTVSSVVDSCKTEISQRQPRLPKTSPIDYSQSWWFKAAAKFTRSKGVIIKSRVGIYGFASGLPDDEIKYLYSLTCSTVLKLAAR